MVDILSNKKVHTKAGQEINMESDLKITQKATTDFKVDALKIEENATTDFKIHGLKVEIKADTQLAAEGSVRQPQRWLRSLKCKAARWPR
jgi:hypothetical protein